MPKLIRNALTQRKIDNAGPGEYGDGNGLALRVQRTGAKSWVQRLRIHKHPVTMGLGALELVSLTEAREIALQNRRIARDGGDPRYVAARPPTFAEVTQIAFDALGDEWRGGPKSKTARDWQLRMTNYALPALGHVPVDQIGTARINELLRPIALEGKHTTAKAVGQQVARVLREAVLREWRDDASDPVAVVLASLPKRQTATKHARSLNYRDVAAALAKIDANGSTKSVKLAVRFIALTACRQIEARRATWDQIDLDAAVWVKPAESMKTNKAHRVPLSTQALDVLRKARKLSRSAHVFPGSKGPMIASDTITAALLKARIDATGHGFRSSFKNWPHQNDVPEVLSEYALAHVEGSATVAAYATDDLLDKRRPVMQAWADAITETGCPQRTRA